MTTRRKTAGNVEHVDFKRAAEDRDYQADRERLAKWQVHNAVRELVEKVRYCNKYSLPTGLSDAALMMLTMIYKEVGDE